jgi:hypothetical protein
VEEEEENQCHPKKCKKPVFDSAVARNANGRQDKGLAMSN